ncbi:MAG: hypothetical protein DRJ38_09325 [Thermoprotei archaeon]|nr:MAG: hypothetical protein DRJ38_09325 [Thermoprotei archaeon]
MAINVRIQLSRRKPIVKRMIESTNSAPQAQGSPFRIAQRIPGAMIMDAASGDTTISPVASPMMDRDMKTIAVEKALAATSRKAMILTTNGVSSKCTYYIELERLKI